MNIVLALIVLLSFPAQAGWLKSFCQRHLIADDPYPYADERFSALISLYFRTHDTTVLDEIVFRMRHGMLTDAEKRLFWESFR